MCRKIPQRRNHLITQSTTNPDATQVPTVEEDAVLAPGGGPQRSYLRTNKRYHQTYRHQRQRYQRPDEDTRQGVLNAPAASIMVFCMRLSA